MIFIKGDSRAYETIEKFLGWKIQEIPGERNMGIIPIEDTNMGIRDIAEGLSYGLDFEFLFRNYEGRVYNLKDPIIPIEIFTFRVDPHGVIKIWEM